MIEIEIRAKLENLATTRESLEAMGAKRAGEQKLIDIVFGRDEDLDQDHKVIEGRFSARIRQKDDDIKIDFKEIRRTGAGHEYTVKIDSLEDGKYFLNNLGYREAFTISKNREIYNLYDFEVALDSVEKLGDFIEIEHSIHDAGQEEEAVKECKELLRQIDPTAVSEPRKYGDLMQELINLNNNKKD